MLSCISCSDVRIGARGMGEGDTSAEIAGTPGGDRGREAIGMARPRAVDPVKRVLAIRDLTYPGTLTLTFWEGVDSRLTRTEVQVSVDGWPAASALMSRGAVAWYSAEPDARVSRAATHV